MSEGKRPRYSPSRLQTYSGCSYSYYLEKILRVGKRAAVWFIQGTSVHAAIEAYERAFRRLEPWRAVQIFKDTWNVELEKARAEQPDEAMWMVGGRRRLSTDIEKRFEQGVQQVIDYIDHNPPGAVLLPYELIPGEPAVEVGFELDFGEFTVIGYIDEILEDQNTGQLVPLDWKTGSKLPVDPYQLATYGLAVTELTGQPVEWAAFWDCRNNERHDVQLTEFTRDKVASWYQQFHDGRKAGVFLPNPGDGCFTCTVRPSCLFAA
jgi:hypothetical protein